MPPLSCANDSAVRRQAKVRLHLRALGNALARHTQMSRSLCACRLGPFLYLLATALAQNCPVCQHGGTCQAVPNSPGQYQCTCASSWQGLDCSTAAAPATSLNASKDACGGCLHGGLCQQVVNSPGSYFCQCQAGWSGTLCDSADTSSAPPVASPASPAATGTSCGSLKCQHGGTCSKTFNSPGSYECHCPAAWQGLDCSEPSGSSLMPAPAPAKAAKPPAPMLEESRDFYSNVEISSFPSGSLQAIQIKLDKVITVLVKAICYTFDPCACKCIVYFSMFHI